MMNIVNQEVQHATLGMGVVASQKDNKISVIFATKTSSFQYPDAFEKFIFALDSDVQKVIESELAKIKFVEKFIRDEKVKESNDSCPIAKNLPKHARPEIFIVFQGKTFEKEFRGGYIWAPIKNSAGNSVHHWERLRDVREGDIILHCDGGWIKAVSRANGCCVERDQPGELRAEKLWREKGRYVDCKYVKINYPIKTSNYKEIIIEKSKAEYSPFNAIGGGNMGYLFKINRELAHIFISESLKFNKNLSDCEFVKEFVNEATI
ncbi:MAG: hypothetical protein RSB59_03040 [Clostridia bacterium]